MGGYWVLSSRVPQRQAGTSRDACPGRVGCWVGHSERPNFIGILDFNRVTRQSIVVIDLKGSRHALVGDYVSVASRGGWPCQARQLA